MTLVISGYNHCTGYTYDYSECIEKGVIKTPTSKSEREPGLFSIADSVITTIGKGGKVPLLKGFKKVVNIPIKLWQPYIAGSHFRGYKTVFKECECFVAFAGSTLTSQHVINLISNHLSMLRIDYRPKIQEKGEFIVIKNCDHNVLVSTADFAHHSEGLFIPELDYKGILTAEIVVDVVEHSINTALKSAKEFRLSEDAFNEMYTEFTLGLNCPASGKDYLYHFQMDKRLNHEGVYEVFANRKYIPENSVSVIGMRKQFGDRINDIVDFSIDNNLNLCDELIKFMKTAIDEVDASGSFEIGMPVVVKKLVDGELRKALVE
ncbi:TPA: hypothetical protein O4F77_000403 [Vibrio alginolyticus]|nr:hypothetical protein [Vibrio alginolyticus]HCZ9048349.1 hypothetical protein [Vibrio alginolyticus]